jgi:protein-disulfide isomerase
MPQLERDYIDTGRVQLVTINLPNSEGATTAALAGACAYSQDAKAYWRFRTLIYDSQTGNDDWVTMESLVDLARTLPGLDTGELKTCIDEARHRGDIERNHELAAAAGVTRTPTVVIGEQGFVGTRYGPIQAALERHLTD